MTKKSKVYRVYLVGSHSTGKTTLARWISQRYKLPMISEVARAVLAEMEIKVDALRTNLDLVDQYQTRVFQRQMEVEEQYTSYVSDRAFDNLAYSAEHATVLSQLIKCKGFEAYLDRVREGTVFYLRPDISLMQDDGTRERVNWEGIIRIDGMVKFMLEQWNIKYLPISTPLMQERTRVVEFTLKGMK